jgi:hypothetical protein
MDRLHDDPSGRDIVLHIAAKYECRAQERFSHKEEYGSYYRTPRSIASWGLIKDPDSEGDYQYCADPRHRPMRKFDDRRQSWVMWKEISIAQWPPVTTTCT